MNYLVAGTVIRNDQKSNLSFGPWGIPNGDTHFLKLSNSKSIQSVITGSE